MEGTMSTHGLWRPELAERLGKPTTTVDNHLNKIREKGLVDTYDVSNEKQGRPKVYWYLTRKGNIALETIKARMREKNQK